MKHNKKVILLILDGWGVGKADKFNAIANAKTPVFDKLMANYPNIQLKSDGPAVGLPVGQSGTSEINHQAIGSGRIILQDLPRISTAIENGEFFVNEQLVGSCTHAIENKSKLHIVGIMSDGGIHASFDHLEAMIKLARQQGVPEVYLHLFTDGRDTPPKSAELYFKRLETSLKDNPNVKIATVQGRFWLDRDRDWERTAKAVDLLVDAKGMKVKGWQEMINLEYNNGRSDEYFNQFVLDDKGLIKDNDAVIFFHYRSDRLFQIVKALIDRKIKNLQITTLIEVSEDIKTDMAFPRVAVTHTLAQLVSEAGKTQYHLSETEKFTHLTFFFNSGREKEYPGESWELIKSNRFVKPYYNLEPTMRAFNITEKIIAKIEENKTDLILVNFPNADMVGHTGNYNAAVVSAEAVDYCVGKIYDVLEPKLNEYVLMITADHGNSEEMWDYENEQPHTQHTTNPVPFIMVSDIACTLDRKESLQDIAPTILALLGIPKPEIMNGTNLIIEKK